MRVSGMTVLATLALALTRPVLAEGALRPTNRAGAAPPATASALVCDGFRNGSARLDRRCRSVLDEVAQLLRSVPGAIVTLTGHADNRDPEQFNTLEGLNRADNARRYLLDVQGIDYERIVVETAGSAQPLADNATATGRARNRNIQIVIASPVRPGNA